MSLESLLGHHLDRAAVRRVAIGLFVLAAIMVLRVGAPLSWDEAVYASRGKDLAASNFTWHQYSGSYWSDLRAPGFPVVLAAGFELFGTFDFLARVITLACSVGLLVVIARTLDILYEPRVGTMAILVTIACPGYLVGSTLAFADIPAAFFSLLAVLVIVDAYARDRQRFLHVVPILIGIATTMRFGAGMLAIAPLVLFGGLAGLRAIRRRAWRELVAYAMAGLSTIVVVWVLLTTKLLTRIDSPIGAKNTTLGNSPEARSQGFRELFEILAPGPVDYGFGGAFWGWSYAVVFVLLTVGVVVRMMLSAQFVRLGLLLVLAIVPALLYGLSVRQFVTTYLAPLFAIGAAMVAVGYWSAAPGGGHDADPATPAPADGGDEPSGGEDDRGRRLAPALLVAVVVVYVGVALAGVRATERMHERLYGFDQIRSAAMVSDDLLGSDCRLISNRVPQVVWYSDCRVASFSRAYAPELDDVDAEFDESESLEQFVSEQGARLGGTPGDTVGFLIVDGLSGQPRIDDVWDARIPDRSAVLYGPRTGRRTAVVAIEIP